MRFANIILLTLLPLLWACNDQPTLPEIEAEALTLDSDQGIFFHKDEPFSGTAVTYFEDGSLEKRTTYLNGKKHGLLQKWSAPDTFAYESNYKENRRHGTATFWWANGNIRGEAQYIEGKLHGIQRQWYQSGAMFKELHYEYGVASGIQRAWRENGKLYANYEARNGRIYGLKRANLCYELDDEKIVYND